MLVQCWKDELAQCVKFSGNGRDRIVHCACVSQTSLWSGMDLISVVRNVDDAGQQKASSRSVKKLLAPT